MERNMSKNYNLRANAVYTADSTNAVDKLIYACSKKMNEGGSQFDSATAEGEASLDGFMSNGRNLANALGTHELPESIKRLQKEGVAGSAMGAVFDSINAYTRTHGIAPTADLIEEALSVAAMQFDNAASSTVTSEGHNPFSLQPNNAVTAIYQTMASANVLTSYLPVDKSSNQAQLIIIDNEAATTTGGYKAGESITGTNSGRSYLLNDRIYPIAVAGGEVLVVPFAGSTTGLPIYAGRTKVLIGGICAATDVVPQQRSNKTFITNTFSYAGTDYKISGEVEPENGKVKVTIEPPLPANTDVQVECFINYENEVTRIHYPSFQTRFQTYKVESMTVQGTIKLGYMSDSQARNEANYDVYGQSNTLIRKHLANEEYRRSLSRAKTIGMMYNYISVNLNLDERSLQITLNESLQDLAASLKQMSSRMVLKTGDYGISVLHVNTDFAALLSQLPSTQYAKSAYPVNPTSIYFDGVLFGSYSVYVDPIAENEDGKAYVICTGRSAQVGLSPFLAGTVQAPFMSKKTDIERSSNYFANFTGRVISEVNPHIKAAMGCAVIEYTGLPAKSASSSIII